MNIYWTTWISDVLPDKYIPEILHYEPISIPLDKELKTLVGSEVIRCPAIINDLKNTFVIKAPVSFDVEIDFENEFYENHIQFYDEEFLSSIVSLTEHNICQLLFPGYLFFAERTCTMTQLPPYLSDNYHSRNTLSLSGTYDIGKWARNIQPAFKILDNRIKFDKGDDLFYIKFNTEEKINLIRFDGSQLNEKGNKGIVENCVLHKRFKKNPFIPTPLSECYDAFIRAKYNKRLLRYIKEHI